MSTTHGIITQYLPCGFNLRIGSYDDMWLTLPCGYGLCILPCGAEEDIGPGGDGLGWAPFDNVLHAAPCGIG